jgi:hypothetical protein
MARIEITIPDWLDKICTWPVMVYRRHKYGYAYRGIFIGEGQFTIVDPDVYYRFGHLKWSACGEDGRLYAARIIKETFAGRVKSVFLHREILDAPKGLLVDHKNGDPLDNRRANLRFATAAQNMHNRRKIRTKTASIYVGVYFNKQIDKWGARIRYQGKRIYLGSFKNESDAGRAYDAAAKKCFGEFARLNFPREDYNVEIRTTND